MTHAQQAEGTAGGMKPPMPTPAKTEERFLNIKEVSRMTAYCRASIYNRMAAGDFPRPVPLGAKRVAWLLSEINAWMLSRIAIRNQSQQQEQQQT